MGSEVWEVGGEQFRVTRTPDGGASCEWLTGPNAGYGFTMGGPSSSLVFVREGEAAPPPQAEVPDWLVRRHIESFLESVDPETGYIED